MRPIWLVLVLASRRSSAPLRNHPAGVHPDVTGHGSCRLSDGAFAADG